MLAVCFLWVKTHLFGGNFVGFTLSEGMLVNGAVENVENGMTTIGDY